MLNCEPQNMYSEIQSAERYRDEHLRSYDRRRRRYFGPSYAGDDVLGYEPENHEFEYVSLLLPKTVFDNPRVKVSSTRMGPIQDIASAVQAGMNRWIRDVKLRKALVRVGLDTFMCWGATVVRMEPDRDRKAPEWSPASLPYRPVVERISPKRIFWDPKALDITEARFIGHVWVRDKDDLEKIAKDYPEDGWDLEVIKGLSADNGTDKLDRDPAMGGPTRNEIVCYEVYVPGYQIEDEPGPEDGFNGALFTLAVGGGSDGSSKACCIRKPRMYYGPAEGPYTLYGIYPVPDETAPLAPTVAIQAQVETLNMHAKAVMKAASQRKRVAFVSRAEPDLQKKVKRAEDGDVVPVNTEELNNNLKEVELGGVTPAALNALQLERERRDRISGMSDAMRGNVAGAGTATENAIAAEASTARMAFIKQQFTDCVTDMLRKVAWYMYHDDRIVFPVGDEIANQSQEMMMSATAGPAGAAMPPPPSVGMPAQKDAAPSEDRFVAKGEPWYQGGVPDEMSGYSFKDLDLDIEPYSMERTSEMQQQRRMMELVQIVTQILPSAMQAPVDLQAMMNAVANMANVPELARIVDIKAAKQLQAAMLQGAVTAASSPPAKLEKDVGGGQPGLVQPGGSPPKSNSRPQARPKTQNASEARGFQPNQKR